MGESPGRVLLTGFEPYDGAQRNPSGEIATKLDGAVIAGMAVVGHVLPVSTARAPDAIRGAIDTVRPRFVVMTGVWPGRAALSIERVAINVRDFAIDDNDGARPVDDPVAASGDPAYLSTLPIRAVVEAWLAHGLPGVISNTAGTFLCNQALYVALEHTATTGPGVCFIHVPNVPAESARRTPPDPSLPLEALVDGVRVAIEALVAAAPGGAAG